LFPDRLRPVDQVQDGMVEDEEAAVDQPAVAGRLFPEAAHQVAVGFDRAETSRRGDRRHRRFLAMLAMEGDQLSDVDRRYSVAISEAEGVAVVQVARYGLEPAAGLRVSAGIHQCDPPGLAPVLMDFEAVVLEVD